MGSNVLIALAIMWRLERSMTAYALPKKLPEISELPTVSVCIPARNERHAMTQCLERVLASTYQKLEVIVFDDSSDDDTSVLIRSFAHAGVRFVPGVPLPEGWLGKNHALNILLEAASGEYLVFMDVDTTITPHAIENLVRYTSSSQKSMVSVIPSRQDTWRLNVPFGSLRYFWQLVLASPHKPAASSALWLIQASALTALGGIGPYKREVQIESRIATQLADSYRCFIDRGQLGVSYEKRWRSQLDTSRRTLYPMVKGWRFLLALLALGIMNAPTGIVIASAAIGWSTTSWLALSILVSQGLIYVLYTKKVWRRIWPLGVIVWPVVIFQELGLLVWSVLGYTFNSVTWKGRLVTTPLKSTQQSKD